MPPTRPTPIDDAALAAVTGGNGDALPPPGGSGLVGLPVGDVIGPAVMLLLGSDLSDTMTGSDLPDALLGAGGDDALAGGLGEDTLLGHDGNDTLAGGGGADRVEGGAGDDLITWRPGEGNDTIIAGEGNDTLELRDTGLTEAALAALLEGLRQSLPGFGYTAGEDGFRISSPGQFQLTIGGEMLTIQGDLTIRLG